MTNGILFNTEKGSRVIDEEFMVPEFIGKVALNPAPYISGLFSSGNVGVTPYYTNSHQVNGLPDSGGRDIIIFWRYPDANGEDIWFYPTSSVVTPVNGSVPGMNIYRRNGSVLPSMPVGYCFAIGRAIASASTYGMRSWDGTGKLIFDSGNLSLKIESFSSISYGYQISNYVIPAASNAAILLPDTYHISDVSVGDAPGYPGSGNSQFYEDRGGVRRNGATFSTYMATVAAYYSRGAEYDRDGSSHSGNAADLSMPIINASLYD
ncbi:hypothetical protein [Janthinobacterium lividum]|uniref:hypothetical protein n=1 Tax=Janthinobacterium lividum TaxID=29581 RepID=UPI00044D82DF|nr:hypothetical protein [Janthinobacterium lividum]EZP39375.1 hypothetical protein BW37_02248 [Janthinobacterium lividum]